MTTDRFLSLLAECAPKAASPESRKAFASSIQAGLHQAYWIGYRSRHALEVNAPFAREMLAIDDAFSKLTAAIRRDPFGAREVKLYDLQVDLHWEGVRTYFAKVLSRIDERVVAKRTRGRNNRAEVVIATMIAEEYRRHFGRFPGNSNQTDANNPYADICKAVGEYLTATKSATRIGPDARKKGVIAAKLKWEDKGRKIAS